MTFGSLFAGIGGIDAALERAGMKCEWQVEIDKQCVSVLRRHWPNVPRTENIMEFARDENPVRPDIVCGGFPCQDLSVAGRRAGLAGKRSGLWHEFQRVLDRLRPRWALIENVPGLLSSNGGRDMGTILWSLGELGYGWAYRVLDAQWFGVPQRRRRVFIVGCLGDGRRAAEVLFERESLPWDSPPRRQAGTRVASTIASGAHPSGFNGRDAETGNLVNSLLHHHGRNDASDNFVAHTLSSEGHDAGEDRTGRGIPLVVGQNGSDVQCGEEMGTLKASMDKRTTGPLVFATTYARNGRGAPAQITRALTSAEGGSHADSKPHVFGGGHAVRRLTPRECERLQGFPDDWTRWDASGKEISDSARYRIIGNAVCVNVAEWIGRRIVGHAEAN